MNASSYEWCRRSDIILDSLPWAKKIVDNVLIWAPTLHELKATVVKVAQNCKKLKISLSKKKIAIGASLPFAGYVISNDRVRPDQECVAAIEKFPAPTNLTGVRSFLGLARQLAFFIPDFAHTMASLRQLLGKKKLLLVSGTPRRIPGS